jgi:hypothetical protein
MSRGCRFGRRRIMAGEGPEAGAGEKWALVGGVPAALG